MKNVSLKDRFITYRSLGTLLDNYCLIASLPIDNEYKINSSVVCNIELSTGGKYEKQDFTFTVYHDNGVITSIYTSEESLLFKVFGDVVENKFNIYIKSFTAGATFKIDILYGNNLGFITFYDRTEFNFKENQFTRKITTKVKEKLYNEEIKLDGGKNSLPFRIQRTKEDGIFNQLVAYVSNVGNAIISRNKDNVNTVGEYDSCISLGETDIEIGLPAGGSLTPRRNASNTLGSSSSKWKSCFLNNGLSIGRTNEPSEVYDDMLYIDATNKKLKYYKSGKWYYISFTAE